MYTLIHRPVAIRWPRLPLLRLRPLPVDCLWEHFFIEGFLLVEAPLLHVTVFFLSDSGWYDRFIIDPGVFERCNLCNGILYFGVSTSGASSSYSRSTWGRPGRWGLRTPDSPLSVPSRAYRRTLVLLVLDPSSATYLSWYHYVISTCGADVGHI